VATSDHEIRAENATVPHEMRFDRQKLRENCDFELYCATLTHEMRFDGQKLEKNCDFELYCAGCPGIILGFDSRKLMKCVIMLRRVRSQSGFPKIMQHYASKKVRKCVIMLRQDCAAKKFPSRFWTLQKCTQKCLCAKTSVCKSVYVQKHLCLKANVCKSVCV